jgi:dihydropteroate synthase type 2
MESGRTDLKNQQGDALRVFRRPRIVGVVNITADSFSDGGKFLAADAAIAHAEQLLADGADILDLGAAASNPHAEHVPADLEIERLAPVVAHLKERGARISIDTTKIEVQRWALGQDVEFLNDIRGFPDASLYDELARSKTKLIAMHFISDLDKAVRVPKTPEEVFDSIRAFFAERLKRLEDAGIAHERIVIDPGMGFFLASNPEPSFAVLGHLAALKREFGFPLMIGVSRKSFLRAFGGKEASDIQTRTLAAEIFAALQGIDYIRTHEARPLRESLLTLDEIQHVIESA